MKITIRRYSKSSKLGMISPIDYDRSANSKESNPIRLFFPSKFITSKYRRDPNITIEEYIRLEEEKARRNVKVYNWETATYGKIWYDDDVHDLRSVENEFPAIVFDDAFTSKVTPSYEPTVSFPNLNDNKIDCRISFDESDDEDYTLIHDENLFSYKIIYVGNLKMDSVNNNDKVNMPSFPSPEPEDLAETMIGTILGKRTCVEIFNPAC
ncbi:hypothetical protein Tco_0813199 [Tanacetum coccineum]